MKTIVQPAAGNPRRGNSLIEAIIAVGVLAVSVPLVFGALAESGETSLSAKAETRTSWVVPACLAELHAARDGKSAFLPQIAPGRAFDNLALAFSGEGAVVGAIDSSTYRTGIKDSSQTIRYIASLNAETLSGSSGAASMRQLRIRLEYPAAAPVEKRRKIDFHTRIP